MRKNKGITLIALVITIIVLLILAGVALSMVAGNEGILSKAETAVTKTEIAGAKEQAEIMLADLSADYYEKRFVDKTETGTLVNYIKSALASEKSTSNGEFKVKVDGENVSVSDKNGNTVVSGTLDENGKVEWNENAGENGESGSGVVIPEGLEVGATVTYSPSGTYNWEAKYASSDFADDGTADVALATGSSVAEGSQDMSITSWKVLSIDENTGKVDLVPSAPTTGTVRLQGAQGYNNAVKMLNDACSSLYGNSSKGISARSINIEDIEGAMTEEALATVHSYVNTSNNNLQYGNQTASAYTGSKQYPTIYAKENLSVINGNKNTTGFGMSEQTALIGRADEGAELGKITTATSIQPYQTYWQKDNAFMQTAFKGNGYNLLIPSGTGTNYWVASRCVYANSGYCYFNVSDFYSGNVYAYYLCNSNGGALSHARALFPVVSLPVNLLSGDAASGWSVE